MLRKSCLLVLFVLSFSGLCQAASGTDSIVARYSRYFRQAVPVASADAYVAKTGLKLTKAGRWPDIDYADTSPSFWPTRDHLGRIKIFAVAWTSRTSNYYQNGQVWQTLSAALDNWLLNRYQNSNWWVNEIGVPQDMRDILVLVGDRLSAEQRKGALEVLNQHRVRGVGANLIWSADLAIHYGALTGHADMIRRNVELVSREVKVTTADGIQPDWSYHQHGPRLQVYHYGLSYLETNVRIAWEMHDTPWSFPPDKISILTRFILEGWQWMSKGINIVPGTIDRAASRQDQLHNADIRNLVPYLDELAPASKMAFDRIAARQNGRGEPLKGFRAFPRSDFAAYHQPGFSFFLKTISTRSLTSESINTENLKGRLLNNGDAYLIGNGREYYNLLPFWNWNLLPGQTSRNNSMDTIIRTGYAGSVTDGQTGAAAMLYKTSGAAAHKFWACHGSEVVCLIGGLQNNGGTDTLFTALDQSRWQTGVTVDKAPEILNVAGTRVYTQSRWLHHAGFGYIMLQPSMLQVSLRKVSSSWSSINQSAPAAMMTDSVFLPLLCHVPGEASAGYVLVQADKPGSVAALAAKPDWKVVSNDTVCQAVSFRDGTLMAAFYGAGSSGTGADRVKVSRPCLLQITAKTLFVSDPLQQGGAVEVMAGGKTYRLTLKEDGTTETVKL